MTGWQEKVGRYVEGCKVGGKETDRKVRKVWVKM